MGYGWIQPVTGGRRVPKDREPSLGTPGNLPHADVAGAQGVFQILIRLVYLRTQTEPWRHGVQAGVPLPRPQDVLWMVRGMEVAARDGGLHEYAQMCARVVAQVQGAQEGLLSGAWFGRLDHWLAGSARYLRDPDNTRNEAELWAAVEALEANPHG